MWQRSMAALLLMLAWAGPARAEAPKSCAEIAALPEGCLCLPGTGDGAAIACVGRYDPPEELREGPHPLTGSYLPILMQVSGEGDEPRWAFARLWRF